MHPVRPTLAATLGGALITSGCFAGPPTVVGTAPSVAPTPAFSPATSQTASPGATATPTPATASATPTPAAVATATPLVVNTAVPATPVPTALVSAPPPGGVVKVIVTGHVYDEAGEPLTHAVVTIKSLDATVPYTATATTLEGTWVVNDIPSDSVAMEVTATKDGFTSRRQVGTFKRVATSRHVMDFGSPKGQPPSNPYFISSHPEIVSVAPAPDLPAGLLGLKLSLSEPLDKLGRDRLLAALRVWPANQAAAGRAPAGAGISDFVAMGGQNDHDGTAGVALPTGPEASGTDAFGAVVREGAKATGGTGEPARGEWNAEGTVLTFRFDAAHFASTAAPARFQVGLVSGGPEARIVDGAGKQLGTAGPNADIAIYPAAGQLLGNAFLKADLGAIQAAAGSRWAATHDSVAPISWQAGAAVP